MRIFTITGTSISESAALESSVDLTRQQGYLWISCDRDEFALRQNEIQATLHARCGMQLVDLHLSDLLNSYLPSRYDFTSQYDLLVFRRLAAGNGARATPPERMERPVLRGGPPILKRIDTNPVGFALFDQVLLTVHPTDCAIRNSYATRLLTAAAAESRAAGAHLPTSPADLMLRIVSQMVDGFLELRRELTHQLDHWQSRLLDPRSRFNDWATLLDARLTLHYLDEICEDQRSAMQNWIDAIKTWPDPPTAPSQRERDLLNVRSRDVLEHIERVVHHVRRLEQSVESAVQLHFNAQGHRTNDIMRTLTALTAIFLPLNLIAAIFGMNFDFIPLIHQHQGFWWALGTMIAIALGLALLFWSKRYLAKSGR